jgi:hypothetical protein
MIDDVRMLLAWIGIAAFERTADGSFRPIAPTPEWFTRLGRDGSFPFLGHILGEASAFWALGTNGLRTWGPCVEIDEDGNEFHYVVKAVTIGVHSFLVFQLDEAAEQLRAVLQQVRSKALDKARAKKA